VVAPVKLWGPSSCSRPAPAFTKVIVPASDPVPERT